MVFSLSLSLSQSIYLYIYMQVEVDSTNITSLMCDFSGSLMVHTWVEKVQPVGCPREMGSGSQG